MRKLILMVLFVSCSTSVSLFSQDTPANSSALSSSMLSGFGPIIFIAGIILAIVMILIGLFILARADFFLAVRETAINTRKTNEGPSYNGLKLASILSIIFGWIVIVLGIVEFIVILVAHSSFK